MESISPEAMREGLKFYDVKEAPFRIYGVFYDGQRFRRVPEEVTKDIPGALTWAAGCPAGGRVRFATNSPYITIKCKWQSLEAMGHMALSGSGGFDLYTYDENGKEIYRKAYRPEYETAKQGFTCTCDLGPLDRDRIVNINMPLYNGVFELYIGIKEGSTLNAAPDYKYEKPILYYGSSITQGGCASRPGMSYEAIVTRRFDINHINLGFSGSAKAEDQIIDYINAQDMSAFVYDYDYNTPSPDYLEQTHERMYKRIRAAHPELPIIIMPAPAHIKYSEMQKREDIIKKTYDNAIAAGDKNVYFIPSKELMPDNDGTVDGCHPNDYGFMCMAKRLINELEGIIK